MESLCEPCVREGKRVDSQFYCTTCEEVYCYACSKKHTMYKISLRHIIKPIKATDITPNYQLYEQMCFSKASLSQSSREDKDMSKASGILHEYIDMSHAARSNNKGATRHQTESKSDTNATTISDQLSTKSDNRSPSTQMQVLNDQSLLKQAVQNDSNTKSYTNATQIKTTTNATGSISLNEEDTTYLHPTHTEYDASESINEIYKEYPYSYADVNTKANARVIDEALTGKRTKRNSGNNINTEDEKTDIHVYDEIEESLVDSSTENPGTGNIYITKHSVVVENNNETSHLKLIYIYIVKIKELKTIYRDMKEIRFSHYLQTKI